MEEMKDDFDERSVLISELMEGKELAKQLLDYVKCPSCPLQDQECLLDKILACFNHGLSMANLAQVMNPSPDTTATPMSEGSSQEQFHDHHRHLQFVSKKRKALPRWTERLRVGSGPLSSLEGPLDDGHSWRKYGQKAIFGAKFPRGYYRCTHRNKRGCLATKQVQRLDEDSAVVQVIYRGHHSCNHASRKHRHQPQSPPPATLVLANSKTIGDHSKQEKQGHLQQMLPSIASAQQLRVKTEGLDNGEPRSLASSFSSALLESENLENFVFYPEGNMMDYFSPDFLSPETSESNYFSAVKAQAQSAQDTCIKGISALSLTNSPVSGLEFSLDQHGIDLYLSFDDYTGSGSFSV